MRVQVGCVNRRSRDAGSSELHPAYVALTGVGARHEHDETEQHIRPLPVGGRDGPADGRSVGASAVSAFAVRGFTMNRLGVQLKSAFGLPARRPVAVPHESLDRRFKVRHSSAPC